LIGDVESEVGSEVQENGGSLGGGRVVAASALDSPVYYVRRCAEPRSYVLLFKSILLGGRIYWVSKSRL